jgi:DnaJ-class molecular chaperone
LRGGQPQPPEKKETTSFPVEIYAKLGLSQGATPHQILGIPSDASADQIKAAFKAKTREWHPDKNPDPLAKEVIQLINWAYRQIGPQ